MAAEEEKSQFTAIFGIFNKLTTQQKIILGSVLAVTFVIIGFLLFAMNEPTYTTLFSNLNPQDAQKTVEYLNAQKIPFKLEDNGQTVKIPKEKLYETRIALASQGIPSSGIIGYELFDQNNLGMSEFQQKLNFKRALEGELTKTILEIQAIEQAKVNIVLPEKNVFKEEEKPTTASVVVKLKPGAMLNKGNILAIINLVSHSVEGLTPENVAVLDDRGRLLSRDFNENDPLVSVSTKQYEVKTQVENYLSQKAQTLLDNVLGMGNSYVTVNVDLNFDQVEKELKSYDPNSQVAISEQKVNQEKVEGQQGQNTQSSSTVNYNVSESFEKIIQGTGVIKRLTVAAVINQNIQKKAELANQPAEGGAPRPQVQQVDLNLLRTELENLVKQSVGVDETRQDQITLSVLPFFGEDLTRREVPSSIVQNIDKFSNIILMVIGVIGALLVIRSLLNKLKNEKVIIGKVEAKDGSEVFVPLQQTSEGQILLPTGKTPEQLEREKKQLQTRKRRELAAMTDEDIEEEITEDAFIREANLNKIKTYVAKNPSEAAKLIHAWLSEDEGY